MKWKMSGLFVVGAVLLSLSAPAASAGDGWYGGGWLAPIRYYQSDRQIPYFAEHPPVYYSYPVPRTYGYSPYAYPPCVMTPDLNLMPEPLEIPNPYVPQSRRQKPSAKSSDKTTSTGKGSSGPLWVINPFVQAIERVAKHGE